MPPRVLCYGVGVDSTALLVELEARDEAPDLVLTADTGAEKTETYEFQRLMRAWMEERSIPYEVVSYETKRFKNWPPYRNLTESLLTNGCHDSSASLIVDHA